MRVATVDGLVTLFYDGSEELYNDELHWEWVADETKYYFHLYDDYDDGWEEWEMSNECREYVRERLSWEQVIIEDGVTEIPRDTFTCCTNIKRVIMANTVIRIEDAAFNYCRCLTYIKLSINIEVIGECAFYGCGLVNVFISPTCKIIKKEAFRANPDLAIFHIHPNVQLGNQLLSGTKLIKDSHFKLDEDHYDDEEVHNWIKNINNDEKYSLHRGVARFNLSSKSSRRLL
ncbi:hypothetical protein CTEN210_05109 [Chaetoceros tenuissimus]|uniref:Uncharacterized protein n=1 Tax=Chaetoceros tenuissimus TaxID=426638 RepID=A0AAD3H3E5_9STRA|nr:hypothetical protein CTEN210_05109 [Chaetoceros tenuissimus]